jgi:hypothetical protein
MNAVGISPLTRIFAVTVTLALAAAIGWAAGSAINQRGGVTSAGYPDGWHPGAAVPASITATTSFSQAALEAVRVTRGEAELAPAPKSFSTQDYANQHPQHSQDAASQSDHGIRHPGYANQHPQHSQDAASQSDHGLRHPAAEKSRQNFTDPKLR